MNNLPYRNIHLDFHTSELLPDIGHDFDKTAFQRALKLGFVDGITLTAKCHHGWSYHPTSANEIHPNLSFDLLGEQLAACREAGVRTSIYISAGYDEKEARRHPEWLCREPDESIRFVPDFISQPGFHFMCFNTGYTDLLLNQIEEVVQRYLPTTLFLDISTPRRCFCAACRAEILSRSEDPRDPQIMQSHSYRVFFRYAQRVKALLTKLGSRCNIFFNTTIRMSERELLQLNTHIEIESLPTGGWGYDHFPLKASFMPNLQKEFLGMTGKFHTMWGEFGGYKHKNALRYETSLALAYGGKCSVGDQLHPLGNMDEDTYRLIGSSYREVEQKEPWCKDTHLCADIGILGNEASFGKLDRDSKEYLADLGINRIMLEKKYLYHFIEGISDFSRYKLIVLPDYIRLDRCLTEKLTRFMEQGGKVLATGLSGLHMQRDSFVVDFGAQFSGASANRPDYIVPHFPLSTGTAAHIMYGQGYNIEIDTGRALACREFSYFNRDVFHFSSHLHTPNNPAEKNPAISINKAETAVYVGWEICSDYAQNGSLHSKEIVSHLIELLLGDSISLKTNLPDRGIVTLLKHGKEEKYVAHFLFAHTSSRGTFSFGSSHPIEVIEDIVPVYQTEVSLKLPHAIQKIYLVPSLTVLPFQMKEGRVCFHIPKIDCHQMVALE